MKKTILITFIFISFVAVTALAQKNIIKTNFTGFLTGDYGFSYERSVNERQSVTFKAGFLKPTLSPFIRQKTITPDVYDMIGASGGVNFSAEYRFYMSGLVQNGFYVAPYMRFMNQKNIYTDEIDKNMFDVDTRINNIGIGAQLGYQWQITERIFADFFFFGAGIDKYRLKLNYVLEQPNSTFDYNTLTDDISEVFEDINYLENRLEFDVTKNYHKTRLPFLFPGFRMGINIGVSF